MHVPIDDSPPRIEALLAERGWLVELARSLVHDDAAAQDLAQDALLAAIERPPSSLPSPRGFLAIVARRLAWRGRRGEARRSRREEETAAHERVPSAADLVAAVEAQQAAAAAVLELPEPYRTTILLRFFRGWKAREVAAAMAVPVATVDTRVHRALARLRRRLDDRFGDRTAWCLPLLGSRLPGGAPTGGILMHAAFKLGAVVVAASVAVAVWLVHDDADGGRVSAHAPGAADSVVIEPALSTAIAPATPPSRDEIAAPATSGVATAAAAPQAIVRIVDEAGAPIEGARVGFEGIAGATVADTDADGRARFEPQDGPRAVAVAAPSHPPCVEALTLTAGEHRVVLARGDVVGGRVTLDGRPPRFPLRLTFAWTGAVDGKAPIAPVLARALELDPWTLATATDGQGAFRFYGLPRDAHGRLSWESALAYRAEDPADSSVAVDRPRDDVALDLRERPRLTARVVDDAGNAVAAARIEASLKGERLSMTCGNIHVDADGRLDWHVPLEVELSDLVRLQLDVDEPGGDRRARAALERPAGPVIDFGTIVLPAPVELAFAAEDESGRPLAGVRACAREGSAGTGRPSDASGTGTLKLTEERETIWFAAVDREVVALEVARSGPPVRVTLHPDSRIRVRVRRADGTAPESVAVAVASARTDAFAVPRLPIATLPGFGPEFADAEQGPGEVTAKGCRFEYSAHGDELRVRRLRPGVPFAVELLDAHGRVLRRETDVVLAPGEERAVEFTLPDSLRSLSIVVLDELRRPIPDASVIVLQDGRPPPSELTDARGIATFDDLAPAACSLLAQARGYAGRRFDGVDPTLSRDVEVQLGPARRVELQVVDALDRPVDGADVYAFEHTGDSFEAFGSWPTALGGGHYVFDSLPAEGAVPFHAVIGGRTYSIVHDSPASLARLVVPAHGRLAVRWSGALGIDAAPRVKLAPLDGGAELEESAVLDPDATSGEHAIAQVLPGRYRVTLEVEDDGGTARVLRSGEVRVVAGTAADVELR